MEKRLLIAFAVSAVILAVYSALFAPPPPAPSPEEGRQPTEVADVRPRDEAQGGEPLEAEEAVGEVAAQEAAEDAVAAEAEESLTLRNDVVAVTISNRGAAVTSYVLLEHEGDDGGELDLVQTVPAPEQALPLQLVEAGGAVDGRLYSIESFGREATLRWSDGRGTSVTKRLALPERGYGLEVEIRRAGDLESSWVAVGTGLRDLGEEERNSRLAVWGDAVYLADGELERLKRAKVKAAHALEPRAVAFAGFEDAYFLNVLRPAGAVEEIVVEPVVFTEPAGEGGEPEETTALRTLVRPRGAVLEGELLGAPKEYRLLHDIGGGVERTLDFGMFGAISVLFLKALWWIHGWAGNYGLAIILLTLGIRIVLFPLMHTSTVSMRKMQKVQPKVKEIQAKYKKKKTDPTARQKMNQEMMELYKLEGVNPMAGCLPLLVQLPILWALYKFFLHAIELRHAPFVLWITDLSAKDPYYVTPILMTGTMWLQQRLAPQMGDPQQQRIMRLLPLIFGIMFLQFPSGLVLYWLTNNVLTIVQQEVTFHLIGERRRGVGRKGAKA